MLKARYVDLALVHIGSEIGNQNVQAPLALGLKKFFGASIAKPRW